MQSSTFLTLPFIQSSQSQKHVTHNEALRVLDAVVHLSVEGISAAPPEAAEDGRRWIVEQGATGAWQGQDGTVAVGEGTAPGGAWTFYTPQAGWIAWNADAGQQLVWTGTDWAPLAPDRVDQFGIGTTADSVNRLAVASDATLLSHNGHGHRVTVNKSATSDTASLVFQSNWSGRAELGLAGEDAFSVKVSDGATWRTALRADPVTGGVEFPSGARTREAVTFGGRWDCQPDSRWISFGFRGPGGDVFAESDGTGAEPAANWGHLGIYLRADTVVHNLEALLRVTSAEVTGIDLRVFFVHGPAQGLWNGVGTSVVSLLSVDGIAASSDWQNLVEPLGDFTAFTDGQLQVAIRPQGALTSRQFALFSGIVEVTP